MKLSLSEHIRRSKEAVAANKAKGNKHAELLANMYTQPSRFIEEILQNTEDAYARKKDNTLMQGIRFKLYADRLEIHHNGKDFDEDDLMAITTFANTTKKNNADVNQIGKFGIGFKSVFSVSDLPEIHCGDFHYCIKDYEVLTACEPKQAEEGFHTLIILPFKRKSIAENYATVRQGLKELNGFHLLFLKKLNRIEVFEADRLHYALDRDVLRLSRHVEKRIIMLHFYGQSHTESVETYLVYTSHGRQQHKFPELAFRVIESGKLYEFRPINDAPLFVYFPLKMSSGLNFLIHAPFTTNPLRDYALFDLDNCPENMQMLNDALSFYVAALNDFKKIGLYSVGFLAKLFIKVSEADSADHQKLIIQRKFFTAFKEFISSGKNLPVDGNRYAGLAEVLIPGDNMFYSLLNSSDLMHLFHKSYFIDADIGSDEASGFRDFLCESLQVKMVDAESFAFRIKVTSGFLEGKPIGWLKHFYKYIHTQQKLWDLPHSGMFYSIRTAPVFLTAKKTFVSAFDEQQNPCLFLPGRKRELLEVVHPKLMEDLFCVAFFTDMGIKIPGDFDDVVHNIIPQFFEGATIPLKDYTNYIDKICRVYGEVSQNDKTLLIGLLEKTPFIWAENAIGDKNLKRPSTVYINNDLLKRYFRSSPGIFFISSAVVQKLTRKHPEIIHSFLSDLGLLVFPLIHYQENLVLTIDGFDDFISAPEFERSKALAKLLHSVPEDYLKQEMILFLRKQKWLYAANGHIVAPEDINMVALSKNYKFDMLEKTRFQMLMGIQTGTNVAEAGDMSWHPHVKPEEVNIGHFAELATTANLSSIDPTVISAIQTAMHFPAVEEIVIREYSKVDLENISKWALDFLHRLLQKDFPQPLYKIEYASLADFVISENEEMVRYVFVCGKTDLMSQYHFTMKQWVNICKLADYANDTFIYFINSVGTSEVSFRCFQNPFEMIVRDKFRLSGSILISPE